MVNKGYDQYLRSKIMTASKGELTLMLYDGAIKFCNMAIMCIDKNDVPGAHMNIKKTEAILDEFLATLDHKYAVATDFENVYNYLHDRLVQANLKKDPEILNEVLGHLRTMRETWKEVMRTAGSQGSAVG
jgi:flagellar protein FliS